MTGVVAGRRVVAWSAVVAGALLAVPGLVLVSRPPAAVPELVFLSTEQYDQLVTAGWLADAGRVLIALGALLVAGAVPWFRGRPPRDRRVGGAALGAGAGLAVLGAALLGASRAAGRAVEGVVPAPLTGPGQWAGLVLVLAGGALLGAGVQRVAGR
ncbi:hypothetical protein GCU67_18660 [Modestobacter muralis]|uniref:Uncharacterized protein n=1 Tax=Modestobacter muralis TaxID=1608614 RepID=A0A6P0HBV6_9ACTN|nr:hypothetical protein [Modestobacter muralis]NEK96172.1 hypothetical protein [Modestobacter muralis]NEN53060.1 hypothetical protein [Modestobacter muralis]